MMRRLLALAAVLLPCAAHAQQAGSPVQIIGSNQYPVAANNPLPTTDANNASFAASAALTPSGTAGTAGRIGGITASATNTGRSFGWNCPSAGLGTVTLLDGSVRQVWMFTNNGADVRGDAFAIVDAEPPSGVSCTFQVYR